MLRWLCLWDEVPLPFSSVRRSVVVPCHVDSVGSILLRDTDAVGGVEVTPAEETPCVTGILSDPRKMSHLAQATIKLASLAPQAEQSRKILEESLCHLHNTPSTIMLSKRAKVAAQDVLRICLGQAFRGRILLEEVNDIRLGDCSSRLVEEDAGDKDAEL